MSDDFCVDIVSPQEAIPFLLQRIDELTAELACTRWGPLRTVKPKE